jgi:NADP-dependent 3-hydroxy acid dehydrogenase YdfG
MDGADSRSRSGRGLRSRERRCRSFGAYRSIALAGIGMVATSITADDVAQIIAFAVSRPRSVSINELLVRPTAQA